MNTSTKNEPFVSVLTPVYNGAEYLEECIQSVLNQTYSNWEYVIVNNQSTDDSSQIIEKYAAQDERIRVHNNKKFLPQMQNLNHAFHQISPDSKYCKVVHADDWLFPECLTKMVAVAEKYPSVGIVSSYRLNDKKVDLDGLPYPSKFNSGREIATKFLLDDIAYFRAPSSILIRADIIREREKFYDESYLAADISACLDVLKDANFGFVHQVLTFARHHENSATNTEGENTFAFIYGELKFQLEFGTYYLTEEEYEKRLSEKIKLFYILLSQNLLQEKSVTEFKRQLQILEDLDVLFEKGKFIKFFFREVLLQLFRSSGLEIKKANKK